LLEDYYTSSFVRKWYIHLAFILSISKSRIRILCAASTHTFVYLKILRQWQSNLLLYKHLWRSFQTACIRCIIYWIHTTF
jgi:hypothetical protein